MRFTLKTTTLARIILLLVLFTSGLTVSQAQINESARNQHWQEDLLFYQQELTKRHKSPLVTGAQTEFIQELQRLRQQIARLTNSQIALELRQITAQLGDGQTSSTPLLSDMTAQPIQRALGWDTTWPEARLLW